MSLIKNKANYGSLGRHLQDLRVGAGIATQNELARVLGVTQQTVSRWEAGLSRPRHKDLAMVARLLSVDQDVLFERAGYAPSRAAATFDRPLPVNALSPESFEQFCADLLERVYRGAAGEVHREGGSGHRQGGIDISVTGAFGRHTFQCKRVNEFGPQKVQAAIAAQTVDATRKFLLLSNIASPAARAVLEDRGDWEIWDRDDLSRRLRSLPKVDQLALVDVYFRGQRLALLGEVERGPWISLEHFFRPYLHQDRLFNHTWNLVGRAAETLHIEEALRDESVVVTLLTGAAGSGKTRLLRDVVTRFQSQRPKSRIWFASDEIQASDLDRLGHDEQLIVVDDAHNRDDLGPLIRFCASETGTRLLLSLRPYGRERVKYQAASFSVSGPLIREIEMGRFTSREAEALALEVLAQRDGPTYLAGDVARATSDSPLATVVGAQIVARERVRPELLGNIEDFRTNLLGRLQDVIAGEIVGGQDARKAQGLLRILSLVQPVLPDDPKLLGLLQDVEEIPAHDATRLLRILTESGVLFRRGTQYRLSPDLLADSIIERHCINHDGSSNGYAEQVFDFASSTYVNNILINLGRLDWRICRGNTVDSRLTVGVWAKLQWQDAYVNPHLDAAAAVAWYQPRMAFDFARRLVDEGHGDDAKVCEILRNVAYHYDFIEEVCALLWEVGQNDPRPIGQHSRHPVRVLRELAAYEPHKPTKHLEQVVRFALALTSASPDLTKPHTPFDILEGALAAEGHSTTASTRRSITISGYETDLDAVGALREEVISALLEQVRNEPPRAAFLGAKTIGQAVRNPLGILGMVPSVEQSERWQQEHARTIERLADILSQHEVHPVVLVRAAESVGWHAYHGTKRVRSAAERVLALLDRNVETRFVRALMDGWGTSTWGFRDSSESAFDQFVGRLISELQLSFAEPSLLYAFVQKWLCSFTEIASEGYGAPHVILNRLISATPAFAKHIVQRYRLGDRGPLGSYVGVALCALLEADVEDARTEIRALRSESLESLRLISEAYARFDPQGRYSIEDILLLRDLFQSKDSIVLRHVSQIVRQIARFDKLLAVDLLCTVDLVAAGEGCHGLLMSLGHKDTIPEEVVRPEQWERLLANLEPVPDISDYWIRALLKSALRVVPDLVIRLMVRRLERATQSTDWSYAPLTKDFGPERGLGLVQVADRDRYLRILLDWAFEHADDPSTRHWFGNVISELYGSFDETILDLLIAWMATGTERHATVVASVLREGPNDIVFRHDSSIRGILHTAQRIGSEALKSISSSLYAATISGVRGTTPGEPFPEDLRLEDHSLAVLDGLSRLDPAYPLFEELLRTARSGIARQRREKEMMDAEDEV